MDSLFTLLNTYGWQLFVLGIISSLVVGVIKTPIKASVYKKYSSLEKEDPKVIALENKFDTFTFLGTFVVSTIVTLIYLFLAQSFEWTRLFSDTIAVWLIQSAVYGIWRKLGLKRILVFILEKIKLVVVKALDKNKDGKISFDEAFASVQDLFKNGKLDVEGVLKKAEEAIPGFVEELVKDVSEEAGDGACINKEDEVKKLINSVQEVTGDTVEAIKGTQEATDQSEDAAKKVEVVKNQFHIIKL